MLSTMLPTMFHITLIWLRH